MKQQQKHHYNSSGQRAVSTMRNAQYGSLVPVGERFSLKNYPCMEE